MRKWHQSWWFRVPVFIAVGLIIASELELFESNAIETCEALIPQLIELSENSRNPFSAKLLKVYDSKPSTTPNTEREPDCIGTTKLSSGNDVTLSFHITKPDSDGDILISYEVQ